MIYNNGNNDLEPEMYNSKLALEKIGSNENINIIMELGREDITIVKLLRPEFIQFHSI